MELPPDAAPAQAVVGAATLAQAAAGAAALAQAAAPASSCRCRRSGHRAAALSEIAKWLRHSTSLSLLEHRFGGESGQRNLLVRVCGIMSPLYMHMSISVLDKNEEIAPG
jgi:hypothetical protein